MVVFVRMTSLQCALLLSTGTELSAGSVDGPKHVMFRLYGTVGVAVNQGWCLAS